jgi:hypothetical protein
MLAGKYAGRSRYHQHQDRSIVDCLDEASSPGPFSDSIFSTLLRRAEKGVGGISLMRLGMSLADFPSL